MQKNKNEPNKYKDTNQNRNRRCLELLESVLAQSRWKIINMGFLDRLISFEFRSVQNF